MEQQSLLLLPMSEQIRNFPLPMETYSYGYSGKLDENGDQEIVDVCREFVANVAVPVISFLKWIEFLAALKREGVKYCHVYQKGVTFERRVMDDGIEFWRYIEKIKGNCLSSSDGAYRASPRFYAYYIEEFERFAIVRIDSRQLEIGFRKVA